MAEFLPCPDDWLGDPRNRSRTSMLPLKYYLEERFHFDLTCAQNMSLQSCGLSMELLNYVPFVPDFVSSGPKAQLNLNDGTGLRETMLRSNWTSLKEYRQFQ